MKTTMKDFAEMINSASEWKLKFNDIIKENGWHDDTDKPFGICNDGAQRLEFDENGKARMIND